MIAPGLDLVNMLDNELDRDFTRSDLGFLQSNLQAAIVEGFEIAEDIDIEVEEEEIKVKIRKSIYESFYLEYLDERIKMIGCPLVSTIAIALTRATGQPLIVKEISSELENRTMIVTYRLLGRSS
ncbi:MAG: hypothetical protein ACUVTL_01390 [Thermoproteota archaeon]